MDGAVTEAVHNLLVTSPRLRAGQWPDPDGGGWTGTQRCRCMGTLGSPAVTLPQARRFLPRSRSPSVSPYLSTTLRRVSLPSTGRSRSSPGLLWGTEGGRVVGAPQLGALPAGTPVAGLEERLVMRCSHHPPTSAVP